MIKLNEASTKVMIEEERVRASERNLKNLLNEKKALHSNGVSRSGRSRPSTSRMIDANEVERVSVLIVE